MNQSESLEWTWRHPEVPSRLSLLLKPPWAGVPCSPVPKHLLAATSWALPLLHVIQTAPVHFYLMTQVYWHLSSSTFQSGEAAWQTQRTYISVALHPAADMGDYSSSVTPWHMLLHSALMTVTSLYFEQGAESHSKNPHFMQALLSRIRLQHLQTPFTF